MNIYLQLNEEETARVNEAMDKRIHKCRNQLDTLTAMLESLREVGITIDTFKPNGVIEEKMD